MKSLIQIWEEDKPKVPFYVNFNAPTFKLDNLKIIRVGATECYRQAFIVDPNCLLKEYNGFNLKDWLGTDNFNIAAGDICFQLIKTKKSRLPKWF